VYFLDLENMQVAARMDTDKYCIGSSRGRGTRAAGWFDDLIQDRGNTKMKSVTLLDGIHGWATAGKEYEALIDGFVPEIWQK
jgi:arsenical-resistance protein 2